MENPKYDQQITNALQQADFGLTQRELAETVPAARATIRKYCDELLEDEEINVIEKAGSLIYFIPEKEDEVSEIQR